jgi:hypothetical protein
VAVTDLIPSGKENSANLTQGIGIEANSVHPMPSDAPIPVGASITDKQIGKLSRTAISSAVKGRLPNLIKAASTARDDMMRIASTPMEGARSFHGALITNNKREDKVDKTEERRAKLFGLTKTDAIITAKKAAIDFFVDGWKSAVQSAGDATSKSLSGIKSKFESKVRKRVVPSYVSCVNEVIVDDQAVCLKRLMSDGTIDTYRIVKGEWGRDWTVEHVSGG